MIPEKWEKIYLYASITEKIETVEETIPYETITKEQIDYIVEHGKMPEDAFVDEEEDENLENLSLTELKTIAKEKGIKGYTKMSKEEIIKELEK